VGNNLSPALEKRYTADLLATRRRIDQLEQERSDIGKLVKSAIDEEWSRDRTLRDLLEGRISEQVEIPGIGDAKSERNRNIGAALRRAIESVERICDVEPEVDPDRPELQPMPGGTGGKTDTPETAGRKAAAAARIGAQLSDLFNRKREPDAPLTWHDEDDGRILGIAAGGLVYSVKVGAQGARWELGKRRGPWCKTVLEAKEAAARAELERLADEKLQNAGAGELTKADTKGAAVARKKGGRR
jgi:hypothetical protein